jgi:S1-C subfamily serine protease
MILLLLTLLGADWTTVVKPLEKQVVRLEMMQGEETGTCSGSVIDAKRGFVLTAAHCIPDVVNVNQMALTVNRRNAELIKLNRILDLAIVQFTVRGEVETVLADSTPEVGTEIVVMGYGFGTKQAAPQFGRITLQRNDAGDRTWINVDTLFGDSGGPVFDALGRQVAMTSAILSRGPAHISAAVRVEDIRDFVEGYTGGK